MKRFFYLYYPLHLAVIGIIRICIYGNIGLQTAMIAQFGAESDSFRKMMNAVTGGVIWLLVILTAVYMLRRSGKMKYEVRSVEQIGE